MSSKNETSVPGEEARSALVPQLRFPEFGEPWNKKILESVGYFTGGGTPNRGNAAYWIGDIPWISSSDLNDDSIRKINISRFISKQAIQESATKLVPAKSILLVSRVGVGKLAVSEFPICTSQDFTNFTPTDANLIFLAYLLKSKKETLLSFNQGTSIKGFTKENIASLILGFPVFEEQQKIADCLSSLDELIAAQARKVDVLKTHKKGLMQQLFPREGEIQPPLRFPEFQNSGEWNVKKLAEIGRVIRGASPRPKGDKRYYGGIIPRLMVQDVTRDGKWVTPQIDSLTVEGAKLSRSCPAGTLTIVCSGVVGVVSFLAIDACIHDGFIALVDIEESLANKYFLFHQLSTLRERFESGATHGGVFTNLTTTGVGQLEIAFPSPAEQHRISSCLDSLDERITAETQKLETLKTHKKGLMQQLFPSPDEAAA